MLNRQKSIKVTPWDSSDPKKNPRPMPIDDSMYASSGNAADFFSRIDSHRKDYRPLTSDYRKTSSGSSRSSHDVDLLRQIDEKISEIRRGQESSISRNDDLHSNMEKILFDFETLSHRSKANNVALKSIGDDLLHTKMSAERAADELEIHLPELKANLETYREYQKTMSVLISSLLDGNKSLEKSIQTIQRTPASSNIDVSDIVKSVEKTLDKMMVLAKETFPRDISVKLDAIHKRLSESGFKSVNPESDLSSLSQLNKLNQLDKLDRLEALSSVSKLSQLSQLSQLSRLSELDGLSQLSKLSHLENLNKLEDLEKLEDIKKLLNSGSNQTEIPLIHRSLQQLASQQPSKVEFEKLHREIIDLISLTLSKADMEQHETKIQKMLDSYNKSKRDDSNEAQVTSKAVTFDENCEKKLEEIVKTISDLSKTVSSGEYEAVCAGIGKQITDLKSALEQDHLAEIVKLNSQLSHLESSQKEEMKDFFENIKKLITKSTADESKSYKEELEGIHKLLIKNAEAYQNDFKLLNSHLDRVATIDSHNHLEEGVQKIQEKIGMLVEKSVQSKDSEIITTGLSQLAKESSALRSILETSDNSAILRSIQETLANLSGLESARQAQEDRANESDDKARASAKRIAELEKLLAERESVADASKETKDQEDIRISLAEVQQKLQESEVRCAGLEKQLGEEREALTKVEMAQQILNNQELFFQNQTRRLEKEVESLQLRKDEKQKELVEVETDLKLKLQTYNELEDRVESFMQRVSQAVENKSRFILGSTTMAILNSHKGEAATAAATANNKKALRNMTQSIVEDQENNELVMPKRGMNRGVYMSPDKMRSQSLAIV